MIKIFMQTNMGSIAVFMNTVEGSNTPVIFLHGIYFDHNLWQNQIAEINDHTTIAIDMPLHGESKNDIPSNWTLNQIAEMLIEILDRLCIRQVIAIGHSWGSMTILRAASIHPERFICAGLCNMPFKPATTKEKRKIKTQHLAMIFRRFYMKKAGKSLFEKKSLQNNPKLINQLLQPMEKLSNKEIKIIDRVVRIDADDTMPLIKNLKVKALYLLGENDYVGKPVPGAVVAFGGHISPLEDNEAVNSLCKKLIKLSAGDLH